MAQSAMGPFYCPPDKQIFLDTGFFREVETRFRGCSGNACKFTAAYIIAHEAGHHIQNLLGILDKARQMQERAGSKARRTQFRSVSNCRPTACPAYGSIAKRRRGRASSKRATSMPRCRQHLRSATTHCSVSRPDVWCPTHSPWLGCSAKRWFMTGYQQGSVQACNTFAPGVQL
jgi:predicted metalloprotease